MKIEKLSYSYQNKNRTTNVFNNLSYDFKDRGMVFVLGKSGSGKSTLLSVLCGFLKPCEGKIVSNLGKPSIVFQDYCLIDELSVYDNVALALTMKGERNDELVNKTLKELDIYDLKDKKCLDLSGGQKGRVALARTIVESSRLILCDEPTGALDSKNSVVVMQTLKSLSKDSLVICVTHNEELAYEYGDIVLRLEEGKLKEEKNESIGFKLAERKESKKGLIHIKDLLKINSILLKKKLGRVICSILAIGFAFSTLCCALSIKNNKELIARTIAKDFYAYDVVHASETMTISQSNGMKLSKNLSLSNDIIEEIKTVHDIKTYPSLLFFMPSSSVLNMSEGKKIAYQIEPSFFDCEVDEEYIGAVINSQFASLTNKNIGDIIIISGEGRSTMSDDYGESLVFKNDWKIKIVGIHEEIQGFSTPTIIYNYMQVYDYINELEFKTGINYLSFANSSKYKEDVITGYETIIKCEDTLSLNEIRKKYFKDRLSLSSRSLSAYESIGGILNSVTDLASMFLIISIVISLFIEMFSLSTIMSEYKREYAIALAFSDKKSLRKLYMGIPLIFMIGSLLSFILFSIGLSNLLPYGLNLLGYPNVFIGGLSLPSIFIMVGSITILTIIVSYFCFLKLVKGNLLLSLRSKR